MAMLKEEAKFLAKLERRQKRLASQGQQLNIPQGASLQELVKLDLKERYTAKAEQTLQFLRRFVVFLAKAAEKNADNLGITENVGDLTGWSQQIYLTLDQYDDLIFEIHDEYFADAHANPIGMLLMSLATHGAMYATAKKLIENPEIKEALQSPHVMDQIKDLLPPGFNIDAMLQQLNIKRPTQPQTNFTQTSRPTDATPVSSVSGQDRVFRDPIRGSLNDNFESKNERFASSRKDLNPPSEKATSELLALMRLQELVEKQTVTNPPVSASSSHSNGAGVASSSNVSMYGSGSSAGSGFGMGGGGVSSSSSLAGLSSPYTSSFQRTSPPQRPDLVSPYEASSMSTFSSGSYGAPKIIEIQPPPKRTSKPQVLSFD